MATSRRPRARSITCCACATFRSDQMHRRAVVGDPRGRPQSRYEEQLHDALWPRRDAREQGRSHAAPAQPSDRTKCTGERWLEIHEAAHNLGMKSNSTMLYGHVETPESKVDHMLRLRNLQIGPNAPASGGWRSTRPPTISV